MPLGPGVATAFKTTTPACQAPQKSAETALVRPRSRRRPQVDANLPRSYLEAHLPYPVIHSALMDIAMGHQTATDDIKHPFTPAVFD